MNGSILAIKPTKSFKVDGWVKILIPEKMPHKYEKYYVCRDCHNGMTIMGGTENSGEMSCPFCSSRTVELRRTIEVSDPDSIDTNS
jgi:DNA-directed RNA polymerase subunit RPC12/RpoP